MLAGVLLSIVSPSGTTRVQRVAVSHRVTAKLIDIALMMGMAAVLPYPMGPLLGFLYSMIGDGIRVGSFRSQSMGKKIMHLRVIHRPTGRPASFKDSILRNIPVGVATFFAIIPVWGWLILGLVGIPLMVLEIYLMLSVDTGHRLGDVLGDTEVVSDRG